jgi:hypothetical protein
VSERSAVESGRAQAYLGSALRRWRRGKRRVTSGEMAREAGTAPTQVRRDLAAFGVGGTRGHGFDPMELAAALRCAVQGGGVHLIAAERSRQVEEEGWDTGHDDDHGADRIASAGAAYAVAPRARLCGDAGRGTLWPFRDGFKPTPDDRLRELVKAGALVAAAIDAEIRALASEASEASEARRTA